MGWQALHNFKESDRGWTQDVVVEQGTQLDPHQLPRSSYSGDVRVCVCVIFVRIFVYVVGEQETQFYTYYLTHVCVCVYCM